MDFISHCIKKSRWKLGSRAMFGVLIILVAFSLLGWIYLTQASHVAMTSRRVQELEADKMRLQEENLQLMVEIAELESVTRLAARAEALGFVHMQAKDAEFLVIADPRLGTDLLAEKAPTDGWWANVAAQFTAWARLEGQ
jgi:cell division protein FtsL